MGHGPWLPGWEGGGAWGRALGRCRWSGTSPTRRPSWRTSPASVCARSGMGDGGAGGQTTARPGAVKSFFDPNFFGPSGRPADLEWLWAVEEGRGGGGRLGVWLSQRPSITPLCPTPPLSPPGIQREFHGSLCSFIFRWDLPLACIPSPSPSHFHTSRHSGGGLTRGWG